MHPLSRGTAQKFFLDYGDRSESSLDFVPLKCMLLTSDGECHSAVVFVFSSSLADICLQLVAWGSSNQIHIPHVNVTILVNISNLYHPNFNEKSNFG
jgi:hypothetical protein